ncbi:hypothetical protein PHLCEN_2v10674 [Hermanssonia centrifuga]|uniref:Uncharacterized protein n=1 Tax=Hermanssonia centrifuga TaxID=98765 RepID=A0A2R6NLY2_9APHY|nr:hypothetical protein PHLCEN_2v10674 [Hermanssonia centrifuga]
MGHPKSDTEPLLSSTARPPSYRTYNQSDTDSTITTYYTESEGSHSHSQKSAEASTRICDQWSRNTAYAQSDADSSTTTYYIPEDPHSYSKKSAKASTCTLSASGGATFTLTGGGLLGSICALLLLVILTLQVLNTVQVPTRDPLDPAERERIRMEWDKEIRGHDETRVKWNEEKIFWKGEHRKWSVWKQQWEVDHQRQARERKLWEEERAHRLGLLWDIPRDEGHCAAYNTRGYTARMNPMLACKSAPIVIHNERVQNEIVGHFIVNSNEPACQPHWGKWYDKGCIGGGMRRVESRLWNLRKDDDWQWMCGTTPATVNGIAFSQPTRCENRGWIWGMVGMFEYPDMSCGWNLMGNISGVEQPPVNTL